MNGRGVRKRSDEIHLDMDLLKTQRTSPEEWEKALSSFIKAITPSADRPDVAPSFVS